MAGTGAWVRTRLLMEFEMLNPSPIRPRLQCCPAIIAGGLRSVSAKGSVHITKYITKTHQPCPYFPTHYHERLLCDICVVLKIFDASQHGIRDKILEPTLHALCFFYDVAC
jgi:hypothetical protein